MPVAVTLYGSILALHIAAVVVTFGGTFVNPLLFRLGAGEPRHRPVVWRAVHTIDRLVTRGMLVVLAAGIYLATDRHYWSEPWVGFSLGALVVIGGVVGGVLVPSERKAIELADRDPDSPELAALERRQGQVGAGLAVLVLVTIYVMTAKPFS